MTQTDYEALRSALEANGEALSERLAHSSPSLQHEQMRVLLKQAANVSLGVLLASTDVSPESASVQEQVESATRAFRKATTALLPPHDLSSDDAIAGIVGTHDALRKTIRVLEVVGKWPI